MFYSKKSDLTQKENVAKKGIKRMDAVVTGVILSGIVASLYGVKKLREKDQKDDHNHEHIIEHPVVPARKKSLLARIFSGK